MEGNRAGSQPPRVYGLSAPARVGAVDRRGGGDGDRDLPVGPAGGYLPRAALASAAGPMDTVCARGPRAGWVPMSAQESCRCRTATPGPRPVSIPLVRS